MADCFSKKRKRTGEEPFSPRKVPRPAPPIPGHTDKFTSDDTVILIVGEGVNVRELLVHAHLIQCDSNFFRSRLAKPWISGEHRVIRLPHQCPDIVTLYLDYQYGLGLPTAEITSADLMVETEEDCYSLLGDLHAFGQAVSNKPFQNVIIQEFLGLASLGGPVLPSSIDRNDIYNSTSAFSPLRRLLVDLQVSYGLEKWLEDDEHSDFLRDLARALSAKVQQCKSVKEFRHRPLRARDYYV